MDPVKNPPRSDADLKRWFSTGFMAGGVSAVDAEKHTLHQAVLIRPGEALGHGMWIDAEFCRAVAAMSAEGKSAQAGLKARFGHPNMCSDALGTFLGRWKGIAVDEAGFVRGDLHLSSTAAESPKGDLRKYVEELAAKEPNHFGASIVFSTDWEAFDAFYEAHSVDEDILDPAGKKIGQRRIFRSPDPANLKNLPHARIAELHAADLVDDPAATDGMFSGAGGAALAAQMTEWLDTHPDVFKALQEPGVLDLVDRYKDQLKPFLSRYSATAETPAAETHVEEQPAPAEPEAEPKQPDAAEPAPAPTVDAPAAQASANAEQIAQLTVERDGAVQRAESAEASLAALNADREQLAARVKQLEAEQATVQAEAEDAKQKLAELLTAQPPASSEAAETTHARGSMYDDARRTK